jgi:AbrB family looped-hinge helix DNA binding protein
MVVSEDLNKSKPYLTLVMDMEFAIAKVSTKGQIVIPSSMREGIKTGDEFLIVKDKDRLVFKNMKKIAAGVKEDLEFARSTEEAYQRIKAGKGRRMSDKEFLEEIKKW